MFGVMQRAIGQSWQNAGQIVTNRNLETTAGFNNGQNGGYFRARVLTAEMDPVFASNDQPTHGVFRQIVAQFKVRIIEKTHELGPQRERVTSRFAQCTGRQSFGLCRCDLRL